MKKTLLLTVVMLVMAVLAVPGWAKTTVGNAVEVQIVTDNGAVLPLYQAGSSNINQRVYAEAVKGAQYSIVVRNLLNRRIGVVIAVDGRNIISGKKSWLKNNERMYILEPFGYGEFKGWRTAQDQINRFYFTDVADSYAAAFNDTSAMGVIALAVYPEVQQYQYQEPWSSSNPAPQGAMPRAEKKALGSASDKAAESAGTGYGHKEYSPSRVVAFDPEHDPAEKIFVKYEWRSTLCAKGIISCEKKHTHNRLWNDNDYAPAPPYKN